MSTEKDLEHAKQQAQAQLDNIKELIVRLHIAEGKEEEEERKEKEGEEEEKEELEREDPEDIRQEISEDPLSVEVRSGWHIPGEKAEEEEYNILLCTGGPAVRIMGGLNQYQEPESARIEYQDWFTPWSDYPLDSEEEEIVLEYARNFYFGE